MPATIEVIGAASPYWWATPLIIVLSATAASILSVISIRQNRSIARTRATIDLIERSESQTYYQSLANTFREIRQDPDGFTPLRSPTNPTLRRQRLELLAFLNHYELIALGCKAGVLDKDFYKNWMRSALVRDWLAAKDFIASLRKPEPDNPEGPHYPDIFKNLEELAQEWGAAKQLDLFEPDGHRRSN